MSDAVQRITQKGPQSEKSLFQSPYLPDWSGFLSKLKTKSNMQPKILRRVEAYELECPFCSATWISRGDRIPKVCPNCKRYWTRPKKQERAELTTEEEAEATEVSS